MRNKITFKTNSDIIRYLCEGITADTKNPNKFYLINTSVLSTKKQIREAWDYTWTLFNAKLIKMFIDTYDYMPSPNALKEFARPQISITVGGEGVFWEVGVQYTNTRLLPFFPQADYEAIVFQATEQMNTEIIKGIVILDERKKYYSN